MHKIDKYHLISRINDRDFIECVKDIIYHTDIDLMINFIQHSDISCLEHSLSVSYKSYRVARFLKLDYKSTARGGLLHDFFLYDWHNKDNRKGLHGFTHPKTAHHNANKLFRLNKKEKDIILKHMWPLTPNPPRHIESIIVIVIDKYCASLEIIQAIGFIKKLKLVFIKN